MKNLRGLFAFALVVCAVPCFAAVDAFLKLEGVKGESRDPAHNGWIEISSFSWGVTNPTASGAAVRSTAAQGCATNEIHFSVRGTDIPQVTHLAAIGHLPLATLDVNGQRHVLEGGAITSCQNNFHASAAGIATANCVMKFQRCQTHSNAVTTASVLNRNTAIASPNASFSLGENAAEDVMIIAVRAQDANNVVVVERGASRAFFRNCVAGAHYKKVTLQMRKAGGDGGSSMRKAGGDVAQFVTFTLKDATVTHVQLNADGSVSLGMKYGMADGSVRSFEAQ